MALNSKYIIKVVMQVILKRFWKGEKVYIKYKY